MLLLVCEQLIIIMPTYIFFYKKIKYTIIPFIEVVGGKGEKIKILIPVYN